LIHREYVTCVSGDQGGKEEEQTYYPIEPAVQKSAGKDYPQRMQKDQNQKKMGGDSVKTADKPPSENILLNVDNGIIRVLGRWGIVKQQKKPAQSKRQKCRYGKPAQTEGVKEADRPLRHRFWE
jgi:hypothetical protein